MPWAACSDRKAYLPVSSPYRDGVQTDALACASVKVIPSSTSLSMDGVCVRAAGFRALTSPYPMSSAKMITMLGNFCARARAGEMLSAVASKGIKTKKQIVFIFTLCFYKFTKNEEGKKGKSLERELYSKEYARYKILIFGFTC
jgi:hypothetical protein